MHEKTNILVVDDERVVRLALARILEGRHTHVGQAGDGTEALREMERRPYDIVLLDLRMPGPDGLTVLKSIKEKWPESEVIVLTGYPTLESAKAAIRSGAYDYLSKPIEPDKMTEVASRALLQKRWTLRQDPLPQAPRVAVH